MRIGLLTLHYIPNYGSALQAYATYELFKNIIRNIDIEIIDYRYDKREKNYSLKKLFYCILQRPKFKDIIRLPYSVINVSYNRRLRKHCLDFLRREAILSKKYNQRTIGDCATLYDSIVVGSDQTWNPLVIEEDNTYLLDFFKSKKYSFSSSFGISSLSSNEAARYYYYLEPFRLISCREPDGKNILLNHGIKQDIKITLDPCMVLERDKWKDLALKGTMQKNRYLFVYMVKNDENLIDIAEKISQITETELIIICTPLILRQSKRLRKLNCRCDLSPYDWLALVYRATYVVTNSFHGTVFSLLFEREVYINNDKKLTLAASRLDYLINIFSLHDHCVENINIYHLPKLIDHVQIEKKIFKLRKDTINYIKDIYDDIMKAK